MNSLFIYSSKYLKEDPLEDPRDCAVTVIFCERSELEMAEVQGAIKTFYDKNYQTEEIFVLCGKYNSALVRSILIDKQEEAFKDVPKVNVGHLADNLFFLVFDKSGKIKEGNGKPIPSNDVLANILKNGLIEIFKNRGGLIEANGSAHHFVFPSGKHSNKFIRTGNILLHSSEIYFIAYHLLKYYKEDDHQRILCDTSSINTIAFALLELKRKLFGTNFNPIPVISFSSYEGIFSKKVNFFQNSLILVSSSTSGNIIRKLRDHDARIDPLDIAILYFLGPDNLYERHKANIICDLTKSINNECGIDYYDTFTDKDCLFCKKGSYPVEIKGDVFLLEKPKINKIMLKVSDAPKGLSTFVKQFISTNPTLDNIFKVNYKDGTSSPNLKYEVYFDMHYLISNISKPRYVRYREKLNDYINQYIPNNIKYLICLPDDGSEKLAEYILSKISEDHDAARLPQVKLFKDIPEHMGDITQSGAAVIVASCISSGKNLLYLSRALRAYEKLKLVYFIGLTTSSDEESLLTLKNNLTQGMYGLKTHSFVEVDNFYSNKDSKGTSWLREKDFINDVSDHFTDKGIQGFDITFLENRVKIIDESMASQSRGLANKLFLPNTEGKELELRKGFAFWNFGSYSGNISQADVYFTISSVINSLRFASSHGQSLSQSEFVRNLLDPGNFHRYNDGIIQACLLRAAYPSEICYHIDHKLSSYMLLILEKIITDHRSPQGEGLLEFLYAIAIEKLTLKKEHLQRVSDLLVSNEHPIVKVFKYRIDEFILKSKPSFTEQIMELESEIENLKLELANR